ncbi:hypothetical protein IEQ34_023194 [Dendrobium chrysotoxum]|uniref:UmuC domain-containing protein n=1 Tax=Dendrobium chrysotoxum TaxID=161865 RepID=A0AAV7FVC1_DENCH|nr:hypothetical protein IEQ34_023194 [Dendrobium chrysotoxum]
MSSYVEASQGVMAIFESYDPHYAQMSLDEAYLDITPYCEMNNTTADAVVMELRERVQTETGLTVSSELLLTKCWQRSAVIGINPTDNFVLSLHATSS